MDYVLACKAANDAVRETYEGHTDAFIFKVNYNVNILVEDQGFSESFVGCAVK